MTKATSHSHPMANRFRGFLPVVIDVETAGLNPHTDALLEIAVIFLAFDEHHMLHPTDIYHEHIIPFPNAHLDPNALAINHIQPDQALRFALPEPDALDTLFQPIDAQLNKTQCQRAVLVGHNPNFDLAFIQQACLRCHKTSPFHRFTTFDTATLSALAVGQTVLAKACRNAGIAFDVAQAHSALYDATKTAELFCWIVNTLTDYSLINT